MIIASYLYLHLTGWNDVIKFCRSILIIQYLIVLSIFISLQTLYLYNATAAKPSIKNQSV